VLTCAGPRGKTHVSIIFVFSWMYFSVVRWLQGWLLARKTDDETVQHK